MRMPCTSPSPRGVGGGAVLPFDRLAAYPAARQMFSSSSVGAASVVGVPPHVPLTPPPPPSLVRALAEDAPAVSARERSAASPP